MSGGQIDVYRAGLNGFKIGIIKSEVWADGVDAVRRGKVSSTLSLPMPGIAIPVRRAWNI